MPLTSKEFKRKHRIDLLRINTGDVNKALPLAHTWYVVFVWHGGWRCVHC